MQTLAAAGDVSAGDRSLLNEVKSHHIASHRVGHRPDRIEPAPLNGVPRSKQRWQEPIVADTAPFFGFDRVMQCPTQVF
jgi:hypothetical protein